MERTDNFSPGYCEYLVQGFAGRNMIVIRIVGIVLGSVAVVGIGGFAIFWFVIKKKSFADLIAVFKKK